MASEHSKACCRTAPVAHVGQYTEKGVWACYNGLKSYQAGSATSKTGILFVYDVFGYTPQTLQGADILSETSFVVVPDFFEGNAAKKEWFARDTEEKRQNIENFMKSRTDPGPSVTRITGADGIMAELKALYPEMTWGAIGYCWGGKIVSLTSGEGSPFKAAVQTSPARLSEDDAKRTRIPMAVLASKDEDAALVKAYGENLDVPAHIETWSNSIHGWMSARADLTDKNQKYEYERGYQVALRFFERYL